jgi:hypothetical protein
VKSAAKIVYGGVKKAVNSDIEKKLLKIADIGATVLSEGTIPPGLVSGVTGAVFQDDPEPEPEQEEVDYGDVPEADYAPLPQIHPKTGQQYSFPAPPVNPRGQPCTNENPPPAPPLPKALKPPKRGGGNYHRTLKGGMVRSNTMDYKFPMMVRGAGVAPRMVVVKNGRTMYFDDRGKLTSKENYNRLISGKGLYAPVVPSY